jgi:2-phospho-L-lactate guanylyltransferase
VYVGSVLVVAGDQAAAELAAAHPGGGGTVGMLIEPAPGLARALAAADAAAAAAPATVVVVADLPLLRAYDVDAVCAAGSRGPCAVVAPTADGGTGALLRRPASLLGTAFGAESAAAHLRLATAAGIPAMRLELSGFALDVDTAEDLRQVALLEAGMGRCSSALSSPQDQG